MRKVISSCVSIALSVLLLSCEPPSVPVYPTCDYCAAPRVDARVYPCRKCGKSHFSCKLESALRANDVRKDAEGFAIGRSIKMCPDQSRR